MAHGVPDKPGPDFFKNEKANDAACWVTIVLGFFFYTFPLWLVAYGFLFNR